MKNRNSKDYWFVGLQFLLFAIYLVPVYTFTFQINHFIKSGLFVFVIVGFLIIAFAILQLNNNLTAFPTPKSNATLITNGLYKYIRHPIYTGIILVTICFGLFQGNGFRISIGLILTILFYFKTQYEESLLSKQFADYADYKKMTGRFFPFF